MTYVALLVELKAGVAGSKYEISVAKSKWRGMTGALNSKHRKIPYSFFLAIGDMPKSQFILDRYELTADIKCLPFGTTRKMRIKKIELSS